MISLQHIGKSYDNTIALQQVSLDFHPGICFGLVGPNGAGKSTLLKIIAGIISCDKGGIKSPHKNIKREIGYVPQEICLSETLTAEQNLKFFGEIHHLKGKELQQRMKEVLQFVGLQDRQKEKVNTFSGGMKRRLNIGCALIHHPKVILLDEPTVGIDPQSRHYILEMIRKMKQDHRTILYSSHYMEEVSKICDEVAFLDKGKILIQQNLDSLVEKHATPTLFVQWKEDTPFIADDTRFGKIHPHKQGYRIEYEQPIETIENVLTYCKEYQLTLEKLELVQPSLEDIFFSFTGEHLRA